MIIVTQLKSIITAYENGRIAPSSVFSTEVKHEYNRLFPATVERCKVYNS